AGILTDAIGSCFAVLNVAGPAPKKSLNRNSWSQRVEQVRAASVTAAISGDARRAVGHKYTTTAANRSGPHQADAHSNHQSCRPCGSDGQRHGDGDCERAAYEYRHPLCLLVTR